MDLLTGAANVIGKVTEIFTDTSSKPADSAAQEGGQTTQKAQTDPKTQTEPSAEIDRKAREDKAAAEAAAGKEAAAKKVAADKLAAEGPLQFQMGPKPTPTPRMKQAAESDKTTDAANKDIDQQKKPEEVDVKGKISWKQLLIELKKLSSLIKPAMKELKEKWDKNAQERETNKQSEEKRLEDLLAGGGEGLQFEKSQGAAQTTPVGGKGEDPVLTATAEKLEGVVASYKAAAQGHPVVGDSGQPVLTAHGTDTAAQPSLAAKAPPAPVAKVSTPVETKVDTPISKPGN